MQRVLSWWYLPRQAVTLGYWAHSLSETPPMTSSAVEAVTSWWQVKEIAKGVPPRIAQENFSSRCYDTESVTDSEQQAVVNIRSESYRTEHHSASSFVTNTTCVRALPVAAGAAGTGAETALPFSNVAHEAEFALMQGSHEQQLAAYDPAEVSTM